MKKHSLVYSTRPEIHAKLCELNGRRNTLNKPIHSSERVGYSFEARSVCEVVNQAARTTTIVGQYKCATHRNRRKKSMHLPTLRALYSKIST